MTKDFHYNGFTSPNGTIVPDDVFDVIAPELTEAELRVLLYIVRRTFGFKKNSDAISVNQMVSGIKTRDGRVLDKGTGMSKSAVWRGANGLVAKGILTRQQTQSENGEYETNVYTLRFVSEAAAEEIEEEKSEKEGVSLQKSNPISPKELPLLSKRDTVSLQKSTQQTDIQETVLQQTGDISSNIRKSTHSNKNGSNDDVLHQTVSQPIRLESQNGHGPESPARAFHGMEGVGEVLKRKRGRPRKYEDELSRTILSFTADFAREFGDHATLNQSNTRLVNDFHRWGRGDMDSFVGFLYQARSITKAKRGIKTSRFAYFCSVLEDLLGLKDDHVNATAPN